MRDVFLFWHPDDRQPIGNATPECAKCSATCKVDTEVVRCPAFDEARRRGVATFAGNRAYLCSNDEIKSARLFREKRRAIANMLPLIRETRNQQRQRLIDEANRLTHNVITLNGQSLQSIYSVIPQEEFLQPTHQALIQEVTKVVRSQPVRVADLIIALYRNENFVKTEFLVYRKLIAGEEDVDRFFHNIHPIVRLVCSAFSDALDESRVQLSIAECYERVYIDYDVVAAALFHIVDNIAKYILPDTTLSVTFGRFANQLKVSFRTQSLRVDPDEVDRIFEQGYSGRHPSRLGMEGKGLGLHTVRLLLALTGGHVRFLPDLDAQRRVNHRGHPYDYNAVEVLLPTER